MKDLYNDDDFNRLMKDLFNEGPFCERVLTLVPIQFNGSTRLVSVSLPVHY